MAPPPKITLAALGGAAAALALQRRRKWLALPYAWRRSATRTELMRWILFDAAPEWATTERMHALRRAVACPAQSVSYANADPLLIVGGQGARLVDVRGRRFLDTRNNVAHVGHAHPRVARAVAAAMTAPCTSGCAWPTCATLLRVSRKRRPRTSTSRAPWPPTISSGSAFA